MSFQCMRYRLSRVDGVVHQPAIHGNGRWSEARLQIPRPKLPNPLAMLNCIAALHQVIFGCETGCTLP